MAAAAVLPAIPGRGSNEVDVMDGFRRAVLLLVIAAAAASTGACDRNNTQAQQPSGGRGSRGIPAGPTPVEVTRVENGRIARNVSVSGNIEPLRLVAVNAQLAGALRSIRVEEGSRVSEGDTLAMLDDREISAQLTSAEAQYDLASAAFQRAERLRERQVITAAEHERDRAALAAATAQRDQLRTRIGYATIRAPITGVVTEKHIEAGDIVGVQTRLFTIADVSTLVVRVRVSELDVVEVRAGDATEVQLDAFPGETLRGRIRRVFPSADPVSRLVPVEVALTGTDAAVARPGFLARVTFALGARDDVRLVPASAIVTDASGNRSVYVIDEGRAERRSVRIGLTSEGRVEITDGIQTGEVIVVTGTNNVRDGAAVRVVNAAATPGEVQRGGGPTS
jgi:membrane fusion protein, multidrug efflux system